MSVRLDDNGTLVRVSHTTPRTAAGVRDLTRALELSATRGLCTLACRQQQQRAHTSTLVTFPCRGKMGFLTQPGALCFSFHLELPVLLTLHGVLCEDIPSPFVRGHRNNCTG